MLSERQLMFLEKFKGSGFLVNNFYLTSGAALGEFYLRHRKTQGLDFFSEKDFSLLDIDLFFNDVKSKLGIQNIDFEQGYKRNFFFLHFPEEVIKIEFTCFPFPRLERGTTELGVQIDSLADIAANKVFSVYQRTKAEDFIDLFFVCKEKGILFRDLIFKTRTKFGWQFDPVQLGTKLLAVKEVMDYPMTIKEFSQSDLEQFFIDEAVKLKDEVLF